MSANYLGEELLITQDTTLDGPGQIFWGSFWAEWPLSAVQLLNE